MYVPLPSLNEKNTKRTHCPAINMPKNYEKFRAFSSGSACRIQEVGERETRKESERERERENATYQFLCPFKQMMPWCVFIHSACFRSHSKLPSSWNSHDRSHEKLQLLCPLPFQLSWIFLLQSKSQKHELNALLHTSFSGTMTQFQRKSVILSESRPRNSTLHMCLHFSFLASGTNLRQAGH